MDLFTRRCSRSLLPVYDLWATWCWRHLMLLTVLTSDAGAAASICSLQMSASLPVYHCLSLSSNSDLLVYTNRIYKKSAAFATEWLIKSSPIGYRLYTSNNTITTACGAGEQNGEGWNCPWSGRVWHAACRSFSIMRLTTGEDISGLVSVGSRGVSV